MTVHKFLFIFLLILEWGSGGRWGGVGEVIYREKDSKDQTIIYKQNTGRILESESLTHSLDKGELFNTR